MRLLKMLYRVYGKTVARFADLHFGVAVDQVPGQIDGVVFPVQSPPLLLRPKTLRELRRQVDHLILSATNHKSISLW